jgi:hypothetical protein
MDTDGYWEDQRKVVQDQIELKHDDQDLCTDVSCIYKAVHTHGVACHRECAICHGLSRNVKFTGIPVLDEDEVIRVPFKDCPGGETIGEAEITQVGNNLRFKAILDSDSAAAQFFADLEHVDGISLSREREPKAMSRESLIGFPCMTLSCTYRQKHKHGFSCSSHCTCKRS